MMTVAQKKEISSNLKSAINYLVAALEQVGTNDHLNKKDLEIVEHHMSLVKKIDSGEIKVD